MSLELVLGTSAGIIVIVVLVFTFLYFCRDKNRHLVLAWNNVPPFKMKSINFSQILNKNSRGRHMCHDSECPVAEKFSQFADAWHCQSLHTCKIVLRSANCFPSTEKNLDVLLKACIFDDRTDSACEQCDAPCHRTKFFCIFQYSSPRLELDRSTYRDWRSDFHA